jgi:hypothetical protein
MVDEKGKTIDEEIWYYSPSEKMKAFHQIRGSETTRYAWTRNHGRMRKWAPHNITDSELYEASLSYSTECSVEE